MAKFGSVSVDIKYCVPCGYGNLASWALSEMFAAGGPDVEISVTPGDAGVFTITVDGEGVQCLGLELYGVGPGSSPSSADLPPILILNPVIGLQ